MSGDLVRLSYRELAERLGVSVDGARMKAKRKGWRVIAGNHPNDTVLVELPPSELKSSVPREQSERRKPEQQLRTQPEQPNERLLAALSEAVGLLRPAHDQIERLTTQLMEAKDAHARDRAELAAAEARELGTVAELERALNDIAGLERQIAQFRQPWWRRKRGD